MQKTGIVPGPGGFQLPKERHQKLQNRCHIMKVKRYTDKEGTTREGRQRSGVFINLKTMQLLWHTTQLLIGGQERCVSECLSFAGQCKKVK